MPCRGRNPLAQLATKAASPPPNGENTKPAAAENGATAPAIRGSLAGVASAPAASGEKRKRTAIEEIMVPSAACDAAGGPGRRRATALTTLVPPLGRGACERQAQEEAKKERQNRKDYWLFRDIVVKVRNKKLADGKYDGKKGKPRSHVGRRHSARTLTENSLESVSGGAAPWQAWSSR